MIDTLEKSGIAERARDSQDRRVVKVHLTDRGKQLRRKFMERRRNELKNIFGSLSREDREKLVNALDTASNVLRSVNISKKL
jgi:DNA-binding MarR family transcriptional regulator